MLVTSAVAWAGGEMEAPLAERLDAALKPLFKSDAPGATVIVTKDGMPVFRKADGLADVDKKTPMQPEMQLRLGSITKQFTAVAILMLAEQGKLSLQDDITRFLPDYPVKGKRITIEHLLQHTSGIPNYTSMMLFGLSAGRDRSVQQMIDSFKDQSLDFEPGARWSYSNSGYFLLGAIIEKVSGDH
jgi:D-alanyl-D-alanine carboxypeptidase